jgi:hypothetical protein
MRRLKWFENVGIALIFADCINFRGCIDDNSKGKQGLPVLFSYHNEFQGMKR